MDSYLTKRYTYIYIVKKEIFVRATAHKLLLASTIGDFRTALMLNRVLATRESLKRDLILRSNAEAFDRSIKIPHQCYIVILVADLEVLGWLVGN